MLLLHFCWLSRIWIYFWPSGRLACSGHYHTIEPFRFCCLHVDWSLGLFRKLLLDLRENCIMDSSNNVENQFPCGVTTGPVTGVGAATGLIAGAGVITGLYLWAQCTCPFSFSCCNTWSSHRTHSRGWSNCGTRSRNWNTRSSLKEYLSFTADKSHHHRVKGCVPFPIALSMPFSVEWEPSCLASLTVKFRLLVTVRH